MKERKVRSKFKALRMKKGTQRKVANDLGVTETTVRNIENGHSDPGVDLVFAFAIYFNVPVEELWPDLMERASKRFS
ncbi:putative transcriptional regulator [Parageobacillus thermantarcticus]|uniref:Putative transcriptional regulator n=1 Tax=Parageobacillus thermantarcticus TaxID=186116 RepID=A0A1I0T7J5_9BACL|nr:helix-turn-helix transcriptional regulator [Parageobacillus thermantarcticus]SFA47768.1 putative transcriptional regulator [Parageobacillus thermantarcticus]